MFATLILAIRIMFPVSPAATARSRSKRGKPRRAVLRRLMRPRTEEDGMDRTSKQACDRWLRLLATTQRHARLTRWWEAW